MSDPKKTAIVCDWLIGGGAEKVVLELHRMYPEAPIYTSYCTPQWREKLDYMVVTGPLQAWPFSRLRKFIPFLRIWWFASLKFKDCDLVLSSSGAEAKGIHTPRGTVHIAYIHAPTHYYWSRYEDYLKRPGFGHLDWLARIGLKLLVGPLRKWDYGAAQRPDYLIANSTHIQQAIKKYYGRDSLVVFPPVAIERFQISKPVEKKSFVTVGRQSPYKRIDLAVIACQRLNLPLLVIGAGPDHKRLRKLAGQQTIFITDASDAEVAEHLAAAQAFIFPGLEDFGIAPVEALASGTPVIAYRGGGALDYVHNKTGLFFDEQTVDSLAEALKKFDPEAFSEKEIKQAAEKFSPENFRKAMEKAISSTLGPAKKS